MDILEQAIHKLDTELEKATEERGYLGAINQIVRLLIIEDENYAEKVLAEKSTLERAYKTMRHIAQKNRGSASCVCIAPDETQDIIGRFYGFWGDPFDFDPDEKIKHPVPAAAKQRLIPAAVKEKLMPPPAASKPADQISLFGGEV